MTSRTTPPSPPLQLPERVRAWARGRCDRILRARADGSVVLTMLLPGETFEATFPNGEAAGLALESADVPWVRLSGLPEAPWSAPESKHRKRNGS